MVMKKYYKTILLMFKKHITRVLSLTTIVLISISIVFGVGSATKKIEASIINDYNEKQVSDIYIKSKNETGFTTDEITKIEEIFRYDENNQMTLVTTFDTLLDELETRIEYVDFKRNINKLEIIEGRMPSKSDEVVTCVSTNYIKGYSIGDKITYNGIQYNVVGTVLDPLLFCKLEEPSNSASTLQNVIYFDKTVMPVTTDIYVRLNNVSFNGITDEYLDKVDSYKDEILQLGDYVVLTLNENMSYKTIFTLTEKIEVIAIIINLAFILVSGLVVLTTISRLIEEERKEIGCLETLGYSSKTIMIKYLLFSLITTVIGSALSFFVGKFVLELIYVNFNNQYYMPTMVNEISLEYFLIGSFSMILTSLIVTIFVSHNLSNERPFNLLKSKAPRPGKVVLLEKIGFIWNRLAFKYKSSIRNVFRYKRNFFMTVISITGATALVFIGLGVLDFSILDETMGESLMFLAFVVVIFAGLLTALVIYILTNINISERTREIATLMVLGYHDYEVVGYIFREIYMMIVIGIIFGLPTGTLVLYLVFESLEFGSIQETSWYVWVLTPIITMLFSIIITFLLWRKITRTNMNDSLKQLE